MKKDEWLDEFWQDEIENIMRRRIDQLIESLHFLCRIIAKTDSIHIEQAYQTDLVHKYREYIDIYIKELKSIRKNGYKTLAMPLNHHVSTKAESFGEHTYVAIRDEDDDAKVEKYQKVSCEYGFEHKVSEEYAKENPHLIQHWIEHK